jgi:hypothetical protein
MFRGRKTGSEVQVLGDTSQDQDDRLDIRRPRRRGSLVLRGLLSTLTVVPAFATIEAIDGQSVSAGDIQVCVAYAFPGGPCIAWVTIPDPGSSPPPAPGGGGGSGGGTGGNAQPKPTAPARPSWDEIKKFAGCEGNGAQELANQLVTSGVLDSSKRAYDVIANCPSDVWDALFGNPDANISPLTADAAAQVAQYLFELANPTTTTEGPTTTAAAVTAPVIVATAPSIAPVATDATTSTQKANPTAKATTTASASTSTTEVKSAATDPVETNVAAPAIVTNKHNTGGGSDLGFLFGGVAALGAAGLGVFALRRRHNNQSGKKTTTLSPSKTDGRAGLLHRSKTDLS